MTHLPMRLRLLHTGLVLGAIFSVPLARAGIPECRDLRLEDLSLGACELRVSGNCQVGCDRLGIYTKACATELRTVCRQDCTLRPDPLCTDECTEQCGADCDRGINVICSHNCFAECQGSCDGQCVDAVNPERCQAQCEATCDGECDVRCRPLLDEACYTHCIECCGGSCTARANMDCQTVCQDQQFEQCERELEVDCSASCGLDGALFCGGEYMLSGADLPSCLRALTERGLFEAEVSTEQSALIGSDSVSCAVGTGGTGGGAEGRESPWIVAIGLGWLISRRWRSPQT